MLLDNYGQRVLEVSVSLSSHRHAPHTDTSSFFRAMSKLILMSGRRAGDSHLPPYTPPLDLKTPPPPLAPATMVMWSWWRPWSPATLPMEPPRSTSLMKTLAPLLSQTPTWRNHRNCSQLRTFPLNSRLLLMTLPPSVTAHQTPSSLLVSTSSCSPSQRSYGTQWRWPDS